MAITQSSETSHSMERHILLWTSIGHFSNHVGNYLTPALLIYLQTDILLTQTERGILGSIPMIMLVFLSPAIGYIGDNRPVWRKHLIWIGMILIGFFGFLMSLANSFTDLAIATIILGVALSSYHPLAFNFLNTMPNKDRNMGVNAVSGNMGSAITPVIAMVFAVLFNWRIAFILFSIYQLIAGFLFGFIFPNSPELHESLNNYTKNEQINEIKFTNQQVLILSLLLVFISAARAPVFRSLSYFTTVVFSDAFLFSNIEASLFSGVVLGIGAFATFIIGVLNNRKALRGATRNQRIQFRAKTIFISNTVAAFLLFLLILTPTHESPLLLAEYVTLTFFFFLGAAILPTILAEITGTSHGMAAAFGLLFSGATLTGAIAPTIFGYLADEIGFNASFLFLSIVAIVCWLLILLFMIIFRKITSQQRNN
ncbi:MAG: MFS transporter [Candidatus Heimdallarchaeota archaeon]|nr:MFS transporter [Candidatus Heimdallarchaeota archaeon]